MNKTILSTALAACLASTGAIAQTDDASTDMAGTGTGSGYGAYAGIGLGAATGALVAGPAGLVIGGIIGSLVTSGQEAQHVVAQTDAVPEQAVPMLPEALSDAADVEPASAPGDNVIASVMLLPEAQAIPDTTGEIEKHSAQLTDILSRDLGLDVFFRSGSVAVEPYFVSRLEFVAGLARAMPDVGVRLEGYSDRRGNADDNLELSKRRLDTVRSELLSAGIEADRIQVEALGEQRFISAAGDLEAYTFDRRVVIRLVPALSGEAAPLASVDPDTTF